MPIIAMDGVDGCGKTTATQLVYDYLTINRGLRAAHIVMPGSTDFGMELRKIVKSKKFDPCPVAERLLFAADTIQFEYQYKSFLESGNWLVCDRFSRITDLIYGSANGLDLASLDALQRAVTMGWKGILCDIYFVFQVDYTTAMQRKQSRAEQDTSRECRIESKGDQFMKKISDLYKSIHPCTYPKPEGSSQLQSLVEARTHKVRCIDASLTPQEIKDRIVSELKSEKML